MSSGCTPGAQVPDHLEATRVGYEEPIHLPVAAEGPEPLAVDVSRCAHACRAGTYRSARTSRREQDARRQLPAGMVSDGTVVLGTVTGEGAPPLDPFDVDPGPPDTGEFPDPWVRWSRTSSVPVSAVVTKPPMLGLAIFHAENWICKSASTSMLPVILSAATGKVTDLVTPCMVSFPVAE